MMLSVQPTKHLIISNQSTIKRNRIEALTEQLVSQITEDPARPGGLGKQALSQFLRLKVC